VVGRVPVSEIITARYLTRFQCLGMACEETCCQGWQVQVDQRHYQILKRAMDRTPAERAEFERSFELDPQPRTEDSHAWIRLQRETQSCPFLTETKLCSVQDRFGVEALPDICATYPRLVARTADHVEMWGTLSCPELARQCLLHEDAMEIMDAPAALTARQSLSAGIVGPPTPYQRYLDDLRGTIFRLLSMRGYPIGTRLFLVSYLGKQTAPFFHKDATAIDEDRLAQVIDHVSTFENVALWHQELSQLPPPESLTARLVTQMLRERLKVPMGSFRVLVDEILASYRDSSGVTMDANDSPSLSVGDLWSAYAARRQSWVGVLPERIDLYFENYAKNYWMREWYVTSPDLLAHAQRLLVRIAILRFLLFGHPALKAAAQADLPEKRQVLDQAAVDVFFKFSRAIEHEGSFLDLLAARLLDDKDAFAHATALALI
jgi:lysine-N-methylase